MLVRLQPMTICLPEERNHHGEILTVGLWRCYFPFTSSFMCIQNRANKHLGEEGWGQAEEGTMCQGR